MARTAECTEPEGNRGRGKWLTVIEMQEYMRASRSKAYDLIWSGEVGSYRLGRKLLVSRASVDAYIESRSGRNDGGGRPGSRPRPGTRGSLETKGARGRP